jgi:hypothetical protein
MATERPEAPFRADERATLTGFLGHNGHADFLRERLDGATGS